MNLRLWIDPEREPPDHTWDWVTTSEAAIALMDGFQDYGLMWVPREYISLTYRLRGDDTTWPVIHWMVENRFYFNQYFIHNCTPAEEATINSVIKEYLSVDSV